jgi:hypothetical protein
MKQDRSAPMPVKYWSFAGLILTSRCNAACECCYMNCSPRSSGPEMSVERALEIWRQLVEASPHGCRVHLTGGEPFLNWPRLIEICRRAKAQGLASLEKVETNAFWATDAGVIRDRIRQLDEAGMGKLAISADPYHQQFVPIERCRLAAQVAGDVLGEDRVQVRWRDWLQNGFNTSDLTDEQRRECFVEYALGGRERLLARAAAFGPDLLLNKGPAIVDSPCREALLRSRHVHIDGDGIVMPGTCAGLALGRLADKTVAQVWDDLKNEQDRPVLGVLARGGPRALAEMAAESGFVAERRYASKCQLCWQVRSHLLAKGEGGWEIAPRWVYG